MAAPDLREEELLQAMRASAARGEVDMVLETDGALSVVTVQRAIRAFMAAVHAEEGGLREQ